MTQYGQKLGLLSAVDTSLSVTAGGSANGSSFDLGLPSAPQPERVDCQFAITNAGSTDGYEPLEVIVQFSDGNVNWPDSGEGSPVFSAYDSAAGADLTRSQLVSFVPLARYARFQYSNGNGTDNLSVSSEIAKAYRQDDS